MGVQVSIIIPAYNSAAYLPATLDSVFRQKGVFKEVIVIDDGSTDATPHVLDRYGNAVRRIRQTNAGTSAARNAGLEAAVGETILFLDSDDLLGEDTLASQYAVLARHPAADIAYCHNHIFEEQGGKTRIVGSYPAYRDIRLEHLCYFNFIPCHTLLLRKAFVRTIGLFNTSLPYCEDREYWLRALLAGATFCYNSKGRALYRRHSANKSQRHAALHMPYDLLLHRYVQEFLSENAIPPSARPTCWLAHIAGCLATARHVRGNRAAFTEILALCEASLKKSAMLFVSSQANMRDRDQLILHYYTLIICALLDILSKSSCASLEFIAKTIHNICPEISLLHGSEKKSFFDALYKKIFYV